MKLFHPLIAQFLVTSTMFLSTPASSEEQPRHGQQTIKFTKEAGGERGFYISLPPNYSASNRYKLLMVFPGTDTTGHGMQEIIGEEWMQSEGLEQSMPDTIVVYPDPKSRYFPGWKSQHLGWQLGPYAGDAAGTEDLAFTAQLLDWLELNYSVDKQKVFATGHSWGGDMTAVVGCFLGDRFTAIAPVAANRPYWFETNGAPLRCKGNAAVWTFFGLDDEHFAKSQNQPGEFGREQDEFWIKKANCSDNKLSVPGISSDITYEHVGCSHDVRLTLYKVSPERAAITSKDAGHQPPDYFPRAVSNWFLSIP
ncbi:TPA: PHB depolymerase family esterase [Pseudomonas aeruginosa]